jgi:hypothetical protein
VCFGPKRQTQVDIPPGATVSYECAVSVKRAGRFEARIDVHLDDAGGLRTITLTVRGNAVVEGELNGRPEP